jgi:hypothetical protein
MTAKLKPRASRQAVPAFNPDAAAHVAAEIEAMKGKLDALQRYIVAARQELPSALPSASAAAATSRLHKCDAATPALMVTGLDCVSIKAGTIFAGRTFVKNTRVSLRGDVLIPGADYAVTIHKNALGIVHLLSAPADASIIGGFHFAPGGNAGADGRGGNAVPAINPRSLWDLNFRPACPDPRGMTQVDVGDRKIWVDIYLLAKDHLAGGTSQFGATIADGNDPPQNSSGGRSAKCDYATAVAVMKHHGKGLLAPEEFYAAAAGVTERSSAKNDPKITGLDAARTSKFGLMQATGNLWVWGHDGTPEKRASFFGGSWWSGVNAGSRYARVACGWPDYSYENLGARGRSDHLQLESTPRQRRRKVVRR